MSPCPWVLALRAGARAYRSRWRRTSSGRVAGTRFSCSLCRRHPCPRVAAENVLRRSFVMSEFDARTRNAVTRHVLMLLAGLVILVAVGAARGQQPKGEPFSTEIMRLKDGLFVIPGYDGAATGGNVAVRVTNEGAIIVDSKLPTLYGDIVSKVKSVTTQPIKYVLNTHQHGDHTGSN